MNSITLNDGAAIPQIGFGTLSLLPGQRNFGAKSDMPCVVFQGQEGEIDEEDRVFRYEAV